jgi:hypothetical protein
MPTRQAATPIYSPIALTSYLAKMVERMVANLLTTYLEEKKIICPQQAAYRKNRSTIDQVAYIAQTAKDRFARGETTAVVSINLHRYKVPHNIPKSG